MIVVQKHSPKHGHMDRMTWRGSGGRRCACTSTVHASDPCQENTYIVYALRYIYISLDILCVCIFVHMHIYKLHTNTHTHIGYTGSNTSVDIFSHFFPKGPWDCAYITPAGSGGRNAMAGAECSKVLECAVGKYERKKMRMRKR